MRLFIFIVLSLLVVTEPAQAQIKDLGSIFPQIEGMATGRIVQMVVLLTVLSIAPGLMIMVTSFTRIIVALSFLRSGIGLQTTPANLILISLALFMTFFVMGPTTDKAWNTGIKPMIDGKINQEQAFEKVVDPFRRFMLSQVRSKDINLFQDLSAASFGARRKPGLEKTDQMDKVDVRVLIPAFMISELRRGFEIGFLIALPFLVIDLIVATITMSMGMMMLPPTVISLPFKILFFILIDGWNLLVGGLIRSFY